MLETDVTHCSYFTQQFFVPHNFVAVNGTCYMTKFVTVLCYGVTLHVCTHLNNVNHKWVNMRVSNLIVTTGFHFADWVMTNTF